MPGYTTRLQSLRLGGRDFTIRSLGDNQQFSDPDGNADRLGISCSQWPLFGQVWPAGQLLADAVCELDVAGKRILELGCGLGLASLVLHQRGAEVVASDIHPLAEVFLAYNAALNGLAAVPYRHLDWHAPVDVGRFDLIIASDVLYEREHVTALIGLIERHGNPACDVLVADPGRGNSGPFVRAMRERGFGIEERRIAMGSDDAAPYRGRVIHGHRVAGNACRAAA